MKVDLKNKNIDSWDQVVLYLQDNNVKEEEILKLDLTYNLLSSFDNCPCFPNLLYLILNNNRIISLEGCPCFPSLKILSMSNNYTHSLEYLPLFPCLIVLNINNNLISSFNGFPLLPQLRGLSLNQNVIESFQGLPNLPLWSLSLSRNDISSFDHCPNFDQLQYLRLETNRFISLKGCPSFYSLDTLYFDDNNELYNDMVYDMPLFPNLIDFTCNRDDNGKSMLYRCEKYRKFNIVDFMLGLGQLKIDGFLLPPYVLLEIYDWMMILELNEIEPLWRLYEVREYQHKRKIDTIIAMKNRIFKEKNK